MACQQPGPSTPVREQLFELAQQRRELDCSLDSLQQQAVALWDSVVDRLNQELPANMPAEERNNMLAVRNRALIQLFLVYDSLSPGVQQLVEQAGAVDSTLAAEMKATNAQFQQLTGQQDSILLKMGAQLPAADYQDLTKSLAEVSKLPCSTTY